MKILVVELYIDVFKFLGYTMAWYQSRWKRFKAAFSENFYNSVEGKVVEIKRRVNAVVREAELTKQETIQKIEKTSVEITGIVRSIDNTTVETRGAITHLDNKAQEVVEILHQIQNRQEAASSLRSGDHDILLGFLADLGSKIELACAGFHGQALLQANHHIYNQKPGMRTSPLARNIC
jgi:hypothetical protein